MGHSLDTKYKILFDDGYESVYLIAFPLMRKYGFKGLVFPIAGYLGKENKWDITFGSFNRANHLTVDQVRALSDSGWEIGSHGLTHTPFTSLSDKKLKKELIESKAILEDAINKKIESITPPFSRFNNRIKDFMLETGYKKIYHQYGFNLNSGDVLIPRHTVYSIDKEKSILRKLNNSKLEILKELIIHKCSTLTIVVKELL